MGPFLATGRVNFLESVQYEYSQTRVFGLPPFESDTKVQSFESYSRMDWTVGPTNRFTGSAMVSPRKTTYAGLNTFNPQGVTPDIRNHNVLGSVSDQVVVGATGVFETRVSVKQFDSTIYPSQGSGPLVLAPDVNAGSYFNEQDRTSRRIEWFTTYASSPMGTAHLLKMGAGVTYETFDDANRSRPVDIVREDGTLSQEITFTGSGLLNRHRTALRGFGQDSWTVSPRLTVQFGARYDYDSFTSDVNVAPRASFTATASEDGRTVIRGSSGVFYDPIPLNVASFVQMQERATTLFQADGVTPLGPAMLMSNLIASAVHTPRRINWNLELDREWFRNVFVRVGYQRGDQRFEPVLNPVRSADGASALVLATDGRSRHREGQGGFIVFPVLDVRTGFPLSVVDEDRNFVGPRNEAGRYPTLVSLDLQVSKRLRLFRHDATVGLKVFNIANHFNPRDFQGNLASADFGGFANGVGRTFRGKWVFEF